MTDERGMTRGEEINEMVSRNQSMPSVRNNNMPANYPETYRDDYRDIFRGYRRDRRNQEKNIFRVENNYRQYNSADEIFETIISHLTKGVKFHDKMMDLYAFMGLDGFKKMHEYQYLTESMDRRHVKCYAIEHMNLLVRDTCDDQGLDFIPQSWYDYSRQTITSESKKQYIGPSFQGYKQWEEETKELLSYCANELMYMGEMAHFNEVMEMVDSVEEEMHELESLMLKLSAVDYSIEYVMDLQDSICEEYCEKIDQLFTEKLQKDKKTRMYRSKYAMEEQYQRRNPLTGRYMR